MLNNNRHKKKFQDNVYWLNSDKLRAKAQKKNVGQWLPNKAENSICAQENDTVSTRVKFWLISTGDNMNSRALWW